MNWLDTAMSSHMEMTKTMPRSKASPIAFMPPFSEKEVRSPKEVFWAAQKASDSMLSLLSCLPSPRRSCGHRKKSSGLRKRHQTQCCHCFHASLLREGVAVTERSLLGCAKGIRLNVVIATDGVVWVVDFSAILHIELLNAGQLTGWRMESGDNLEWHLGVDLELRAWAVEVPVAHTECVNVATVTVCRSNEAITILGTALLILHAHIETLLGGWVWCECGGNLVGLPQIHLCAAGAHVASSAVVIRVGLVRDPALAVALAIHPLEVAGALSITVTSSVGGTSCVGWAHVASLLHLGEVDGRVGSARHV